MGESLQRHTNSLRHPIRLLAVAFLLACPARTQAQDAGNVAGLRWLAGCWLMRSGALTIEEQWLAPGGGILLGTSRTTRGDYLVAYEFMRIYQRPDSLVFAASPSGQQPAEFTGAIIGPREVVFENSSHDFPQRIGYLAVGSDSLIARIEGRQRGEPRTITFPYARTPCTP